MFTTQKPHGECAIRGLCARARLCVCLCVRGCVLCACATRVYCKSPSSGASRSSSSSSWIVVCCEKRYYTNVFVIAKRECTACLCVTSPEAKVRHVRHVQHLIVCPCVRVCVLWLPQEASVRSLASRFVAKRRSRNLADCRKSAALLLYYLYVCYTICCACILMRCACAVYLV